MSESSVPWGELYKLCRKMHRIMYEKHKEDEARQELPALERLLLRVPEDSGAIIAAEASAIYHELKGDREQAIVDRKLEIALLHALHQNVRDNAYDAQTKQAILRGRNKKDLEVRENILLNLESRG